MCISIDTFKMEYEYNIKQIYGQEGNGTKLNSYSCRSIQGMASGGSASSFVGCPFKSMSTDINGLQSILQEHSNAEACCDIKEVVGHVKKGQWNLACSQFSDIAHIPFSP